MFGIRMMLLSLLALPLLGDSLKLESRYSFKQSTLYSHDFFPGVPTFPVLEISRDLNLYKVRSSEIVKEFEKHGIRVEAKTPIIEFVKSSSGNFSELEERVGELFVKEHSKNQILVRGVQVSPTTSVELEGWRLLEIDFDSKLLKRSTGTFSAYFSDVVGNKRKSFFRYEIDATLEAIFTKETLKGGDVLDSGSVEIRRIPFERITSEWMRKDQVGKVSVKSYTSPETLLTQDRIIPKIVVRRGDVVRVRIQEGAVSLEFSATAQQEGAVGSKIRVRNEKNKKSYDVKIIDSMTAIIE